MMPIFNCPRCGHTNHYTTIPKQSGYARCSECNVALEWEKHGDSIQITNYFIPEWCSVSPKTDRILEPQIGFKGSTGGLKLFAVLQFPGAKRTLRKKKIYDGELQR